MEEPDSVVPPPPDRYELAFQFVGQAVTLCGKGTAKWSEKRHSGTAMSFDDRLSNECMVATASSGSPEILGYVAEFFTIGAIG